MEENTYYTTKEDETCVIHHNIYDYITAKKTMVRTVEIELLVQLAKLTTFLANRSLSTRIASILILVEARAPKK